MLCQSVSMDSSYCDLQPIDKWAFVAMRDYTVTSKAKRQRLADVSSIQMSVRETDILLFNTTSHN